MDAKILMLTLLYCYKYLYIIQKKINKLSLFHLGEILYIIYG